ncbi:MarR family winged helix-turn-helix transcriptional regulator [Candidatus Enterococcus ikei]|uniref:MarR family transcriptional regulator n=1 Tax=Candidatus Enterococcus ikei TaxID=2815326 RepID=A0ABS3GZC8_9ENTE|nr:MarR family transcriptional regulator [Enterococcus sp. DIV0869a]MBO0440106.1 MarR family transcriptional regulator [Enterococcus sp. DIV0869a]
MEEQTLMEQFLSLQAMMQRYFMKRRREHGPFGNPHRGQGRVLNLLKLKPETTQKELSYLLDMRPQSLGELLGKLEKNGYISREPLESDRRVMVIRLTEAGMAAADNSKQEEETIFDVLSESEQESFKIILSKLLETLEAEIPEEERDFRGSHMRCRHGGHGHGHGRGFGGGPGKMDPRFDPRDMFGSPDFPKRGKFGFDSFKQNTEDDDGFNDF